MSDKDLPLQLVQALNDETQHQIDVTQPSVAQWINNKVEVKRIKNSRLGYQTDDITCLCFASKCSDVRTVLRLVHAGADVTVADSHGHTPLILACRSDVDAKQKAAYLLQCDASLLSVSDVINGWTPLIFAACAGNTDCVRMLIDEFGASPNDADKLGFSCLHQAARYGTLDTVKLLTSYPQCDIDRKNKYGETAADFAKYGQHRENADFLTTLSQQRKRGASPQPASAAGEAVAAVTSAMTECSVTDDKKSYGRQLCE